MKPRQYWMEGLRKRCGCARKKWKDCDHPWYFEFCHDLKEYKFSLHRVPEKHPRGYFMSKDEAEILRDRLRSEIKAGTFNHPKFVAPPAAADPRLTFGDLADLYLKKHVPVDANGRARRPAGKKLMECYVRALRRIEVPAAHGATVLLETKPLDAITAADLEAVEERWRRRTTGSREGLVGVKRALKRLRHMWNWAKKKGYAERSSFERADIHFGKEQGRNRRLEGGEEQRLLQHAPPHLQVLVLAALQTGCRKGELLALRWRDVKWDQNVLLLPREITKTAEDRDIPITLRLKAVLDMRRFGPDGVTELGPDAHVFGDEIGRPVKTIRDAWEKTCESAKITNLHFHDLRREFASRLLESGVASQHDVAAVLGHADITTTSRYLRTTRVRLQGVMKHFEDKRDADIRAENRADADQQSESPADDAPQNPSNSLN